MVGPLPSPAKKRLIGEGAWVAFGAAARAVALLVGIRVLTKLVRPDVYGAMSWREQDTRPRSSGLK